MNNKMKYIVSILFVLVTTCRGDDYINVATPCDQPLASLCSSPTVALKCGKLRNCLLKKLNANSSSDDILQRLNQDRTPLCIACKKFLKDAEFYMTHDKEFLEKSKQYFKDFWCNGLFYRVESVCDMVIDNYIEDVVKSVADDIDGLCEYFWFCDTIENTQKNMKNNQLEGPTTNGEPLCSDCNAFIKEFKKLLTDKSFLADITKFSMDWCRKTEVFFPDEVVVLCVNITRDYMAKCLYLIGWVPWEQACDKFFCETSQTYLFDNRAVSKSKVQEYGKQYHNETKEKPKTNWFYCYVCKRIIKQIKLHIPANASKEEIISKLSSLMCGMAFGVQKKQCLMIIAENGEAMFKFIQENGSPANVCFLSGFCATNETTSEKGEFNFLDWLIPLKTDSALPESGRTKSEKGEYNILNWLIPQNSDSSVLPSSGSQSSSSISDSLACDSCEQMIQFIAKTLQNPSTASATSELLKFVCNAVSSSASVQEKCGSLIEMYGSNVINMLFSFVEPKTVCVMMQMCGNTVKPIDGMNTNTYKSILESIGKINEGNGADVNTYKDDTKSRGKIYEGNGLKVYMYKTNSQSDASNSQSDDSNIFGGKPCSYGSIYWCRSLETAKECGAVDFCKKKQELLSKDSFLKTIF